jgi:site-specific DNA recombinase
MNAAIYARFSSDRQKESSIEDQFRNCEQAATKQGWTVTARYADQAISGSTTDRPQYQDMLRDAEGKQFEVLLVDDLSRLSRDQVETERTRRRLVHWGVRLIGVSDGIDTATKGHKLLSTMKGLMNEEYLVELADKTHRGLTGQALKGNNCGGRTYGYRHVPTYHPTETDEYGRPRIIAVRREIDPEQARWVRQIFTWYAEGQGPRWIAGELNRLGVPGPAATWKRKKQTAHSGTWSASALHGDPKVFTGLLHNPLYIGLPVWNRRRWVRDPETKRKTPTLRPKSEWIEKERPELRIVPQALWDRVQARQRAQAQVQVHSGRPPKYLLSGLLKCGQCGANYVVQDYYRYGCAGRLYRGLAVCTNEICVARTLVETKVLAGLKTDLFTPDAFALFTRETTRLLKAHQRQQRPEGRQAQKQLAAVEREIANIMTAIKVGILTPTTKAELERAEAERARLQARLKAGPTTGVTVLSVLPQAEARYRRVVETLAAPPARHVEQARQQIKDLVGEIKLVPTAEGYLEAEMAGRYAGLLKLAVGASFGATLKNVVGEPPQPSFSPDSSLV